MGPGSVPRHGHPSRLALPLVLAGILAHPGPVEAAGSCPTPDVGTAGEPAGEALLRDASSDPGREDPDGRTPLTEAEALRAAGALAHYNWAEIRRIDGLLRSGALGEPDSQQARRRAHLLARLSLRNWYAFVFSYALDPKRVWVAGPSDLAPVISRFCESGIFPVAQLREVRMGLGRVSARYDLREKTEGWTVMGGRRLRYRVKDVRIAGTLHRVLAFGWHSAAAGDPEILIGQRFAFRVTLLVGLCSGAPYQVFLVHDVSGAWISRHGVHQPAAFAFWTTPLEDLPAWSPDAARVGTAVYLPDLRFRLPLFLPDLRLDDWRTLGLPVPFVQADRFRQENLPSWLALREPLQPEGWTSIGDVPQELRVLFPDR